MFYEYTALGRFTVSEFKSKIRNLRIREVTLSMSNQITLFRLGGGEKPMHNLAVFTRETARSAPY